MIPAFNESTQIGGVIETMPDYVDWVIIVDDASTDDMVTVVSQYQQHDSRLVLLHHDINQGCGGALATGYVWARDNRMDIAVRMDGDGQMSPNDLPALLDPVARERADYAKGNRLVTGEAYQKIPRIRYFGNDFLSLLTKIASGYWHVADVPVEPVYHVGEKSGIRIRKVIFTISWLLIKMFLWRMKEKYIIRDFHPLVFFYTLGAMFGVSTVMLFARMVYFRWVSGFFPSTSSLAAMFSFMSASLFTLFAMWFDMEANKDLKCGMFYEKRK
ncbi:MAG: glycosyltransferase family 2 protein [Deltaproteobacteria bacterium]